LDDVDGRDKAWDKAWDKPGHDGWGAAAVIRFVQGDWPQAGTNSQ
jgi:hypothetical protein